MWGLRVVCGAGDLGCRDADLADEAEDGGRRVGREEESLVAVQEAPGGCGGGASASWRVAWWRVCATVVR